jgi:hypothetical protein
MKSKSRMKSYLIVAAIAAGVLLASTKIPKIRAFVYGPPTA